MTTINWRNVQTALGVAADGVPGKGTYTALLSHVAQRQVNPEIGEAMARLLPKYEVDADPIRLSQWCGQTCHESSRYVYMRELWGPTAAQKRYDGRLDLGNTVTGDGYRFRGAGLIQVTGRDWFEKIGARLGIPADQLGQAAGSAHNAVLVSLEWWALNDMNDRASKGDDRATTRKINGGYNGLEDRIVRTTRARTILKS